MTEPRNPMQLSHINRVEVIHHPTTTPYSRSRSAGASVTYKITVTCVPTLAMLERLYPKGNA